MRKKIGFILLLCILVIFKIGYSVADRDYRVKPLTRDLSNLPANAVFLYHVPDVVRFLGTDIYRPQGYFTQTLNRFPQEKVESITMKEVKVKAMTTGLAAKLDNRTVRQLGLEVDFTFWEAYGKWMLLGAVLCLLFVFFWK